MKYQLQFLLINNTQLDVYREFYDEDELADWLIDFSDMQDDQINIVNSSEHLPLLINKQHVIAVIPNYVGQQPKQGGFLCHSEKEKVSPLSAQTSVRW